MVEITDYQILQRDPTGYAMGIFCGDIPAEYNERGRVYARAVREDDGLTIVGWKLCQIEKGIWRTEMHLPEGGLYRLEASWCEGETSPEWALRVKTIHYIGVGDLFMLTGQSNMAGYGRDAAYDPPQLGVHLYGNNGRWNVAAHPLNDSVGTIYPENAEYTSSTSPALAFGRRLMERLGIPIGLIQASRGSSALTEWHPEEDVSLYRAMLRRLDVVGPIKGVLWYQGCSDANATDANRYLERYARMVELWRDRIGKVPFLTVQLNRRTTVGELEESHRYWGLICEAQRQAARQIPDVYVVPSLDLPVTDGIHNSSGANVIIGERLANTALQGIYGKSGQLAPSVSAVEYVDEMHVYVGFPSDFCMTTIDEVGDDMNLEDVDGLISCVRATNWKNGFLVTAARPIQLPARFYALWRCCPPAFVPRDKHGMPMLACYGVDVKVPH